jgi:hypothetical protein
MSQSRFAQIARLQAHEVPAAQMAGALQRQECLFNIVENRAVAELVGNEDGVVSGVFNLESSDVEASDWRPRHDKHYHEA